MNTKEERAKRHRDASRKYRENNPDRVKEQYDRWKSKNPKRPNQITAKYRANNKEKSRVLVRNRRARIRSAKGKHSEADIKDILRLQRSKCAYPWCRKSLKSGYQVDHIEALANGGANDRKNLQLLCAQCNRKKHARNPIEFAQSHGLLL